MYAANVLEMKNAFADHADFRTSVPGSIQDLTFDELDLVDGGKADVGEVAGGVAAYGAATMGLLALTGPIGWGMAGAYLLTCAAAGAMIGDGLSK